MRKLLNVLYVTTPESYLSKDGMNVVVSLKQEEKFRIPIINIEGIVTFGYMGISPGLMKLCFEYNVSVTFLSPSGSFISRIQGGTKGNVLLRKLQYKYSEDSAFSLQLSKLFIGAKIQNSRSVLCRFMRDYGKNEFLENLASILSIRKNETINISSSDELRGIEGDAASVYFNAFPRLILNKESSFSFHGRNRRPPKDPINALLSLSYTLIANDVAAALETIGLDPYVGFFHTLRPGRTSLALDLMEEMRAYLGDRFVLSLINRKQLSSKDFLWQGEESVILTDNGRRIFITAWQNRKKEKIQHPYLREDIPIGLLPYVQAMLLARYIRNDLDNYPAFIFH